MSHTQDELISQPECWELAARLASGRAGAFPRQGERIAVVGCGSSFFMAQVYAALREAAGHGETDAFPASDFPIRRRYDRWIALSRSGTTTEVLRVLEQRSDAPITVVTATPGSPIVAQADDVILLDFADERSVVQTRSATSALALFRTHLGQDLTPVIAEAREALRDPLVDDLTRFDHFVFLGSGWTVGLANEAALKLREAAQAHTESYPTMEYRHGPVSVADERSLVWMLGAGDAALADEVRRTGATVRVGERDAMAELVAIHRLAVALAVSRGLDPDHPRFLARSIMLGA